MGHQAGVGHQAGISILRAETGRGGAGQQGKEGTVREQGELGSR